MWRYRLWQEECLRIVPVVVKGKGQHNSVVANALPSQLPELPQDDSECRKCPGRTNVIVRTKVLEPLLCRYSSWESLRKAIAWLVCFKEYLVGLLNKDPGSIPKGPLTVSEVIKAESVTVKAVQRDAFPVELALVGQKEPRDQKKCVPRSSPIRNLNPFVADGILRVGGRLENAPILFQTKHPVILPSKHHVTNLIIQNCHCQQGHCGPSQVLAFIRQRFWIVRGLSAVRKVLDYFGPLFVKQGRSQVKRYGCLFTCLTMRAVHIEVAHTLEADSFICAYQCFVSRRGKPKEIYSDNGTNFTGAERG